MANQITTHGFSVLFLLEDHTSVQKTKVTEKDTDVLETSLKLESSVLQLEKQKD